MPERWIVRVEGKEYGPVDFDTLSEWKREGRLLPSNEARLETQTGWSSAGAVPGLFAPPPLPAGSEQELTRRRTFGEIIRDSFRIYKSAFIPFFFVTLLVTIPTTAFELTSPAYGIFGRNATGLSPANIVALFAFIALLLSWPVFVAAIQIASLDVLEDRKVHLGALLRRAVNFFPRFARLSLIVYGSYLIWTAIPVLAILSLVSYGPSVGVLLLALAFLCLQVGMVARLFVNFLFWQQSAIVSNLDGAAAIRESKALARSQRRPRKLDRPLWRGALLASLWLLIVLGLSSGAEVPFVLSRMQGISTPEEIVRVLQSINAPQSADMMLITGAVVSSLLHALVRPIFGIAFVLLYFDTRADFTEQELMAMREQ